MAYRCFSSPKKILGPTVGVLVQLVIFQNCSGFRSIDNTTAQHPVSSACPETPATLPMQKSIVQAQVFKASDEHTGRLNTYFLSSTGVTVSAAYAECPNAVEKIDLYRLVNSEWIIQNRCYVNSLASVGAPNSGYCSFRQPLPVGTSVGAGQIFVRVWNIGPDCQTYADEGGDPNGYQDFSVTGLIQDESTYSSAMQARGIVIQKSSYKMKVDSHGGATYELYSLRNSQPEQQWVNSIHANLGAALQVAIHNGAPRSLTSQPCGGQGYYNPTQAGASCSYMGSLGGPMSPVPGDPMSGLEIQCDGVHNNSCASATAEVVWSPYRMMNWDYGPGYNGPYNPGDQITLAQDIKTEDHLIEVDLQIHNSGAAMIGAMELPSYYFNNQFRQITYGDCSGTHSLTMPINRSGNDGQNFAQIISQQEPLWITFTNNSGMTGADTFTIAWMYGTAFEAAIDPIWIGRGVGVSDTAIYHQVKMNNVRLVSFASYVTYHAKYVIFPYAASEIITSRFGTLSVSDTIARLRADYKTQTY